jgi:hypothetical protein
MTCLYKEVDAGKTETPVGDKVAPKRSKPTQKSTQQKKGGVAKKDVQAGKDTSPQKKEQGAGIRKHREPLDIYSTVTRAT